ncbi:hypothetical protein [Streptomyces sp. NPDC050504]|uniref:hypothetical protein n=1 Tax=Streptomyces sp. NPDC050504 TaxID=3365618 RepID=UPI0037B3B7DE
MTPLERLLRDELPSCPEHPTPRPADSRTAPAWTPQQQAQHRADLAAALDGWTDRTNPRHLHAVRNEAA